MRAAVYLAIGSWLAATAGCGGYTAQPRKVIATSPAGAVPVLAESKNTKTYPTSTIAPATFEAPVEALPIKPFTAWSEQEAAADALGRMGPAAVPALTEALRNPDVAVRQKAVEVLARLGADATDAVPDLVRLLLQRPG